MLHRYHGLRIAVAGLGVSGLAVARACKELGAFPTVLDQQPGDSDRIIAAVDQLSGEGIPVVTGWHGRLDRADYDLLVVSPGLPPRHPVMSDMVGKVIGEIEFAYQVAKAPILAVTGTNGKSTTTSMLWLLLRDSGGALCGNIAGSGFPEQVFTTAAMNTKEFGYLVAEVSSAQLETVDEFKPRVAAITNLSQDHLDRYGSFEEYRKAKLNLLSRMSTGDTIVVNTDEDAVTPALARKLSQGANVVCYSPSGHGEQTGVTRQVGDVVFFGDEKISVQELPFYGAHNVTNARMAWEMASALGRPLSLDHLLEFRGLDNRMEIVGKNRGVTVVNNSMCTNPMAIVKSSQGWPGRHHLLLGGNTKNMDFSPLREYLEDTAHEVYLFGDNPEPLSSMLGGRWPAFSTLKEAFDYAIERASDGESVMLSPGCASAEPYRNFKERGEAFRKMAKEWLENEKDL
ncbi:UDP-N-acetylmuramoyl-L-alanine--D-glutamate ligase [Kamptonema cortianum]|nr:UDP-N-acetylmuramoyl-L-alanine--D-glutamate ligase [Geitlerinema splendidum]MDK3158821.1 UDP-N-acetylmuramoyl-L-alanine--D-glutamate ligase [Kamptonema cortianum]